MSPTARGLAGICLGFLMITLDATIVNVALGAIGADLGGALSAAQWIVNAYTITFAALLLSAGALADRLGARTAFLGGLAVFALGSAGCALAGSVGALVAARVVQGAGAAALMPCSLALITHAFPEGEQRRRALGAWAGASGLGLAAGPVLGGALTAALGWRAIFLVNVPVAAVAAALLTHVAETPRHRHPFDVPGQLLAAAGLAALTGACITGGARGWGAPATVGLFGAAAVALAAFAAVERARARPMVDLALFGDRAFSAAVGIGLVFNFCLYGAIFCLAVDLHRSLGQGPVRAGLALVPLTAATATMAVLSGRLVARVGEWRAIGAGLGAGAAGGLLLALDAGTRSVAVLAASSVPLGLTALAMPAMTAVAMRHAPRPRIGLAAGVFNAARGRPARAPRTRAFTRDPTGAPRRSTTGA